MKSRRSVIAGGLAALSVGLGATSSVSASSEVGLEAFRVEGKRQTTITYDPETITVTVEKRSADLPRRLASGAGRLTERTAYDRTELGPGADRWPTRGRDVTVEDWQTHVATTDEWRALHEREQRDEVGIHHSHDGSEADYGHAVWIYSHAEGSSYERRHPINVVFDLSDRTYDDVQETILDAGWSHLDADALPPHEHRRFAWNQERERFEESHASLGYAWTFGDPNIWGVNGRYHVQSWEFVDGLVGMHCHEDTPVPHSVEAYGTAEAEVRNLFAVDGWSTAANARSLPNAQDDHDGNATLVQD